MSRSGFVGFIDSVGSLLASSDQLKCVETSGSRGFGVKIDVFSMFSCFFAKIAGAARVSMPETIPVVSGDSVGRCDSKTARKSALFCPLLAGI